MSGYKKMDEYDELDLLLRRQPVWADIPSQQKQQQQQQHHHQQTSEYDTVPHTNYSSKKISAIPPKIVFHVFIHEEVTTLKTMHNHDNHDNDDATYDKMNHDTSDVMIDGTIHVKLISSDASNNIPFQLTASSLQQGNISLSYNTAVTVREDMNTTIVKIPKSIKGKIHIADYRLVMDNETMPFVIERKLMRTGGKDIMQYTLCLKIYSNILESSSVHVGVVDEEDTNHPTQFTNIVAAIAIPPTIIASSIEVIHGMNYTSMDELRRIIKLKIPSLSSIRKNDDKEEEDSMIDIQILFQVIPSIDDVSIDEYKFPILLRCDSTNCIMSDISLGVSSLSSSSASVIQHKSLQLWYRV